jgi:hypothetical protein
MLSPITCSTNLTSLLFDSTVIYSFKTANPQRAQVRKALSPAFSFSNLHRCVAAKLDALMLHTARAYDRRAQAGTVFSIKEVIFCNVITSINSCLMSDIK